MAETGTADLSNITRDLLDSIFIDARANTTCSIQSVIPCVIAQAYEVIRRAPTQMNSQPLRLPLVQSPAAKYRLGPHMKRGNRDKTLAAPLTVIAAWDPNWHNHLPQLAPHKEGAREKLDPDEPARENKIGRAHV